MYKEIFKLIKKYDSIVIARHVGVDPDAYGSQIALKSIILNLFPNKKVYAVGSGSAKFRFIGELDKVDPIINKESLLIVLDTPIKRRVDIESMDDFACTLKIDHHPFDEKFCEYEWIEDNASSVCQMIYDLCKNTKFELIKYAAERIFMGIITDTNRFLFSYSTPYTLKVAADLMENYKIDTSDIYGKLYMRSISELKLQGFISQNMKITENGFGYILITDSMIKEFGVDAASAGNMVNNFTYIDELLVWATFSEDVKQNLVRVSLRSRGPIINEVANQYGGGGHKQASGIKIENFDKVDEIVSKMDELCKKYKEEAKSE